MAWIAIDYHYLIVTSDAGIEHFDDPRRTQDSCRSGGGDGRARALAPPDQRLRHRPRRPQTAAYLLKHIGRVFGEGKRPRRAREQRR